MAKSIISNEKKCFLCGSTQWIEKHHVFGGACRKLSEKYGLTVYLCHYCHNEPGGVHHSAEVREKLQKQVQEAAMKHYGWDERIFITIFGRNYT